MVVDKARSKQLWKTLWPTSPATVTLFSISIIFISCLLRILLTWSKEFHQHTLYLLGWHWLILVLKWFPQVLDFWWKKSANKLWSLGFCSDQKSFLFHFRWTVSMTFVSMGQTNPSNPNLGTSLVEISVSSVCLTLPDLTITQTFTSYYGTTGRVNSRALPHRSLQSRRYLLAKPLLLLFSLINDI